jgi:uncharacterized coiled-coil DUF342 family protein
MTRANRALAVVVVACLGLWGCAQGPTNGSASAERLRSLETKHSKLEDDFRSATATRDQLRKKLAAAEEQRAQLQQQLEQIQGAVRERDELRTELTARTGERDNVQNQFDQFRKGIRGLLGQVEASNGKPGNAPVTSTTSNVKGPRL